jgi:hypothetical protein
MDKSPASIARKRNRKSSSGDSGGDSGRDSGDAGFQLNEPKRRCMERVDGPNADDDVFHPNPT